MTGHFPVLEGADNFVLRSMPAATDAHSCHAGAWVQGNVYTLPLANLDPQRVYQVRLTASASNDSFGDVYFRKAR